MPPKKILKHLHKGAVIPAHPLALNRERKLDERRQRALTRYYLAAGAGGVAVGVHTTQFEIHDPKISLFRPVLELAADTLDNYPPQKGPPMIRVAGICGRTPQAVREAALAADLGYHAGLVSFTALRRASTQKLLSHVRAIAEVIPVFGFYLQPPVGGRLLPYGFWRKFVEIDNVVAIKIAPFNRYQTQDVIRALVDSGRARDVALYTGNDDNIVADLLTQFRFSENRKAPTVRIVGGLLGHWAFWTRRAVGYWLECRRIVKEQKLPIPRRMLTLGVQVTNVNAAVFDPAHGFAGCIPGIHEILRRQGLLQGRWCLNPRETVSPGQMSEIARVYAAYPHLSDDPLVAENLDDWLK